MNKNKAVFLDRDGTINRDVNYCARTADFEILPGVSEAIKLLNENGYKVIVITNQSGLARGCFTETGLAEIHGYMQKELAKHGARIDAIYYCPHHPDDNCACRKPRPELILRAIAEHGIDPALSYMVGDAGKDVAAGKAAGCRTVWINTGQYDAPAGEADYTVANLPEAVKCILSAAPAD